MKSLSAAHGFCGDARCRVDIYLYRSRRESRSLRSNHGRSLNRSTVIRELILSIAFIVMSNKVDAAAKDAEGKMESALGDITGDKGHQIKGQAKQVQASVMNATEDLKEAAQSLARKVTGSTEKNTDDVS